MKYGVAILKGLPTERFRRRHIVILRCGLAHLTKHQVCLSNVGIC
ncbi:hypothetical protein LMG29739_01955 [Paraburkholderia solisilvae]|uniref:Uncharacterized protein n=1 Tax=Paraburkholderia solisilvae TaxID=624376 RepID=A0A6J5DKD7_9BURK|nr:hypothetical protein LMG29739_01955 [Paraburkholderia solisilvae]